MWSCQAPPEQIELNTAIEMIVTTEIDENTNIHFTGKYCGQCHEKIPDKGGAYLRYNGDYQLLCRCHHGQSPGYCHPLEDIATLNQKMTVPAGFPLTNGKFTCNTCHDVYRQCRKRLFDRYTLRGAPYPKETDFCYLCHDSEIYHKLNPHLQIQSDGTPNEKMCLYCHAEKPDEKTATFKEVTFIGDMKALCRRCHPIQGNHPGDFDHMANPPSAKALAHFATMEEKFLHHSAIGEMMAE